MTEASPSAESGGGPGRDAGEIDPVEAQNHIGIDDQLGAAAVQRVVGRKCGAGFAVGHHSRAERLSQGDAPLPGFRVTRSAAGEDQRPPPRNQ
jgi:hypothetical protein